MVLIEYTWRLSSWGWMYYVIYRGLTIYSTNLRQRIDFVDLWSVAFDLSVFHIEDFGGCRTGRLASGGTDRVTAAKPGCSLHSNPYHHHSFLVL